MVAAAEKAGLKPQEFVDGYHAKDESEFRQLGFSFDVFHRTSSAENRETTQAFYDGLKKKGFIYTREVEAPYCTSCSRFLPDRFVVGTCPHCAAEGVYSDYCEACGRALRSGELLEPRCITCNTPPVRRTSLHYFLKLSAFSVKLAKWLGENRELQEEVVNYVSNWVKEGLADWDISRDMEWGVPVPGEKGKVFYVWFDAPIGYVSSTKAWAKASVRKWEDYWQNPETKIYHFIGKDIVYHHYLFWPAMLMGVGGYNLPFAIPTRGYLNLEGRKFSKSRNWFVSLESFLREFPPDYLRYYETAITGYDVQDADFYWKDFQQKINNELVANFGNFIHRTLVLSKKICGSKVPKPEGMDARDKETLLRLEERKESIGRLLDSIELRKAQEELLALSAEFNKYLSDKEPWKEKDAAKAGNCIYVCLRGVAALSILCSPFLPFTAKKIAEMLGLEGGKPAWEDAALELLAPGAELKEAKPLFEKVGDEKVAEMEAALRGG